MVSPTYYLFHKHIDISIYLILVVPHKMNIFDSLIEFHPGLLSCASALYGYENVLFTY